MLQYLYFPEFLNKYNRELYPFVPSFKFEHLAGQKQRPTVSCSRRYISHISKTLLTLTFSRETTFSAILLGCIKEQYKIELLSLRESGC